MSSYLTRNGEFQKNSKKIQQIKKHHYSFFSRQNRLGIALKERKKKKKIVLMSFYQIRNRKLQKNCKKIKKIEKHHYALFFSQNKWGKAEKGRKKKKSFR